jgi:peroxiredoxin
MVTVGDEAPDFTAPLANGDVESFTLSERLGEAPLVLAFFPAAFTGTCTNEMKSFQERLGEFEAAGATVYGVSVDSPFALNEFREQNDLTFDLVSDANREVVEAYDVTMDFEAVGIRDLAKRAVFVVDAEGTVTYAWVSDDAGVEPEYDEVLAATAEPSVADADDD